MKNETRATYAAAAAALHNYRYNLNLSRKANAAIKQELIAAEACAAAAVRKEAHAALAAQHASR